MNPNINYSIIQCQHRTNNNLRHIRFYYIVKIGKKSYVVYYLSDWAAAVDVTGMAGAGRHVRVIQRCGYLLYSLQFLVNLPLCGLYTGAGYTSENTVLII